MDGFKNTTKMKYMGGGMVDGYSMGGYAKGGNAKPMMAKGGDAKVGVKIAKVMGEFKKGDLHSGSKEGPKVKSSKQAMAIALSEAGKGKGKMPMKKNEGGKIGKMPPIGESVKSGNRMSKMTAAEMREMEARFGNKRRPSPADSVRSANRIAKEEDNDSRSLSVFKQGGKVRKYAEGGPVRKTMPPSTPMPDLNETMSNLRNQFGVMGSSGQYDMKGLQDLVNSVNTAYSQRGATADQVKDAYMRGFTNLQKTPPVDIEMPRLRQVMPPVDIEMPRRTPEPLPPPPPPLPPRTYDKFRPQVMPPLTMEPMEPQMPQVSRPEPSSRPTYYDRSRSQLMPPLMMEEPTPPPMQKIYEPRRPTPPMPPTMPEPYYPGNDVFRPTPTPVYDNFPPAIIDRPRDPMQPQNPPGMGGTSSAIRDLLTKQPPTTGPRTPGGGMGLLGQRQPRMPEKSVMMKHGGRAAMSKGKR